MAKEENKQPEIPKQTIVPVNIVKEMRSSYLDYAMSVIVSRALPDVRDGLKPVHRRILYTLHELGLVPGGKTRKSAKIVGAVTGNYHPHGTVAAYESMVTMAQDFRMRYPLVIGQGNFGSIDGDSAGADRYTEAKMSRIAQEMLRDIEKDTVQFIPNYEGTRKEPTVLPTVVPALLLNGTLGIAVGMATHIPPHNIREVLDALIYMTQQRDATTEDLLEFVKGPDFPTGGIIFNQKDIEHAYATGRGGVVTRGEAEISESKSGAYQIVITSIPYQINKADLIMKIADLVHEKKLEGIKDIRDESTTLDDLRITIDLKQGTSPQNILNSLYKHTELETTFHFNMLALVDGIPQTLSLKVICEEFVKHRQQVVTRRTKFDLARAEERAHILEGFKKALDHIDAIIKTIKKSKDTPTAHLALQKEFKFSELQSTAILEMKLARLSGLERQKIEDELKEKLELIKELKSILASSAKVLSIIRKEFEEIKEKYGDDRKTKVVKGGAKVFSQEDLIADEETMLVLTQGGYLKRTRPEEYRRQKRGGVGVIDLDTKEEDFITILQSATTHNDLLFFSDKGKCYQLKMYEIPEGKRATKGKSIMNFLPLAALERVTSVLPMPKAVKEMKELSLMMVTRGGVAKKVSAESFKDVRRSGIIAIKLQAGDELLSTLSVAKGDTITLATARGQSIRFKESDIREMGRTAGGVRGIKLGKGDSVIGADVVTKDQEKNAELLVMGANGYGKKTSIGEYKVQKRSGSGIKTAKVTGKTGTLMVSRVLTDPESEIVAISKQGQVIRVSAGEIPSLGRQTQGVRIMKLREGDSIASFAFL